MHIYVHQKKWKRMLISNITCNSPKTSPEDMYKNIHNSIICKTPSCKGSTCPSTVEWINHGTFTQWNIKQQWDWTKYKYTQYGWIS